MSYDKLHINSLVKHMVEVQMSTTLVKKNSFNRSVWHKTQILSPLKHPAQSPTLPHKPLKPFHTNLSNPFTQTSQTLPHKPLKPFHTNLSNPSTQTSPIPQGALESQVRNWYDTASKLEEEKYDLEFKLRKLDIEVNSIYF